MEKPNKMEIYREIVAREKYEPRKPRGYSDRALDFISDEIDRLGRLVASGDDMDERFVDAVAKFKETIKTSDLIPGDLAVNFTSRDYQPYSNQQAYVDELKRELKWCRDDMAKVRGSHDVLQGKKTYTIDADGVIHRDGMGEKPALTADLVNAALEILRGRTVDDMQTQTKKEFATDNKIFWDRVRDLGKK